MTQTIIDPIIQKSRQLITTPLIIGPAILFVVVLILIIRYFAKKSKREKRESKIVQLVRGLVSGIKSIGQLKRPWPFVIHSVLIWLLYFLSMYLCFFAMPATTGLGPTAALLLLVAGGLGMSAPVQGGIGAYHILVSQGLMLYGLSKQDGLAFATLLHATQMVIIILLGSASLLLLFIHSKKPS